MIANMTGMKISAEKRELSLREQLMQAQDDARRWEADIAGLQEELDIVMAENQHRVN